MKVRARKRRLATRTPWPTISSFPVAAGVSDWLNRIVKEPSPTNASLQMKVRYSVRSWDRKMVSAFNGISANMFIGVTSAFGEQASA